MRSASKASEPPSPLGPWPAIFTTTAFCFSHTTSYNSPAVPTLKSQSRQSLTETKTRYTKLITAMKKAEAKMPPVLTAFRDQVLALKHNLNARAIASLSSTLGEIEGDIALLIKDIDASIKESERFLATLETAG